LKRHRFSTGIETPVARFIRTAELCATDAMSQGLRFDAYVVAEPVSLRIRILVTARTQSGKKKQQRRISISADPPPNESMYRSKMFQAAPANQPLLADLELPRTGSSSEADFHVYPQRPVAV
jgi:hypothetical protein